MEKSNGLALRRILLILFSVFYFHSGLWAQDPTTSSEKKTSSSDATSQRKTSAPSTDPTSDSDLSKSTFDQQPVIDEVKAQLATLSSKLMIELIEFCRKNSIQGEYVVDLTLEGKGKVLTVFIVSASMDDIPKKNLLKNKLLALSFENIKIPKKGKVKSRYTLKF